MKENFLLIKFVFSEIAKKIDEIDLTLITYCHIDSKDFVNFFGLLRKPELYEQPPNSSQSS